MHYGDRGVGSKDRGDGVVTMGIGEVGVGIRNGVGGTEERFSQGILG